MHRPINLSFLSISTSTTKRENVKLNIPNLNLGKLFSKSTTTTTIAKPIIALPNMPNEAMNQDILEIPQFKIKAPILRPTKASLAEIYTLLRKGVVLFPGSSDLGGDYSIIIGHSSSYP